MSKRNNRNMRRAVQNVRVVDEYSGTDGAYVDRCLQQLHNSESQITVLCSYQSTLTTTTTPNLFISLNATGAQVRACDEFISIAAQFNEYRIRCIRVDIYDINTSVAAANMWSTVHEDRVTIPTANFDTVVDRPDSQSVPPGTGKVQLSWRMHGQPETEFQSIDPDLSPVDFGGVQGSVAPATAVAAKYQYVVKAVVDFRGRK
jgi:hypothetical protein